MGRRRHHECDACTTKPVMRCGRCTVTRCEAHALPSGARCERCERDWVEDAPIRRQAKVIFVPTIAVLAGGLLFGLLLPVSIGGAIGAALMCALACAAAVGAGAGACRLVDRNARALFLRERSGGLPPARLLPAPRHR
jgi:hypothetical protein